MNEKSLYLISKLRIKELLIFVSFAWFFVIVLQLVMAMNRITYQLIDEIGIMIWYCFAPFLWIYVNSRKESVSLRNFFCSINTNGIKENNFAKYVLAGIIYCIFQVSIMNIATLLLATIDPVFATNETLERIEKARDMFSSSNYITSTIIFINTVIIVPFVEELLFRGVILNKLHNKVSLLKAVIFCSILFGVIHIKGVITAIIFGILMSLLYIRTKSLTGPVICHMINNLFLSLEKPITKLIFNVEYKSIAIYEQLFLFSLAGCIITFSIIVYFVLSSRKYLVNIQNRETIMK